MDGPLGCCKRSVCKMAVVLFHMTKFGERVKLQHVHGDCTNGGLQLIICYIRGTTRSMYPGNHTKHDTRVL